MVGEPAHRCNEWPALRADRCDEYHSSFSGSLRSPQWTALRADQCDEYHTAILGRTPIKASLRERPRHSPRLHSLVFSVLGNARVWSLNVATLRAGVAVVKDHIAVAMCPADWRFASLPPTTPALLSHSYDQTHPFPALRKKLAAASGNGAYPTG